MLEGASILLASPLAGLAQAQQQPGIIGALFPFLIVLVIFYFLLIRPAQRQRKRQQAMLGALKTGDKVVTNGGLYGTIVALRGSIVQLRIAEQVKVEILRSHIAGPQQAPGEEPKG